MTSYQIRARSVTNPGDFLVQDTAGECRVYFGARGSFSLTSLEPSLAEALAQSSAWQREGSDTWLSQEELMQYALDFEHLGDTSLAPGS